MTQWQRAVNDESARSQKLAREYVLDGIRRFFKESSYREVETPLFTPTPDPEPSIEPFRAEEVLANSKQVEGYLITSPEFAMKRILSAGSGSIFQISKAFRSLELPGSRHNGEFTILEWYSVGKDYTHLMDECLALIRFLVAFVARSAQLGGTALLEKDIPVIDSLLYQDKVYNLQTLEKISYTEAMERYAGVTEAMLFDQSLLSQRMQELGYEKTSEYSQLDMLSLLYIDKIEPNLGVEGLTILYDFPADQAALSRKKVNDPRYAERFELFLGGMELGNAFTELTDVEEQKRRLENQLQERRATGRRSWEPDRGLLQAMEHGMPQTAGIAVGVDRLSMVLLNAPSISDVLWFPEEDWVFEV